jgi:hypothetical protein
MASQLDGTSSAPGANGKTRSRDIFGPEVVGWRITIVALTSVLIPAITNVITHKFPVYQSIFFTLIFFSAVTSAELLVTTSKLRAANDAADRMWDAHRRDDASLSSIRKSLRTIETFEPAEDSLFRSYFKQRVDDLERDARTCSDSRELEVRSNHLQRADRILRDFAGNEIDVIYSVHALSDNADFKDDLVQAWFERISEMTELGRVRHVKRLLVASSSHQETEEFSEILIQFHKTRMPTYDCRVLDKNHFEITMRDLNVDLADIDFAIYRSQYAFLGRPKGQSERVGTWVSDLERVDQLYSLFDKCWKHSKVRNPHLPTGRRLVTTQYLYSAADRCYPNPSTRAEPPTSSTGPISRTRIRSPLTAFLQRLRFWFAWFRPSKDVSERRHP